MKIKYITTSLFGILCLTALSVKLWNAEPQSVSIVPKKSYQKIRKNKAFSVLAGWERADLRPSLLAFRNSCKVFLKQNPEHNVGNAHFSLKAKDWQPACRAAMHINENSMHKVKEFFQSWFKPVAIIGKKPTNGTFTGYYAASVNGSYHQSAQFPIPIHSKHGVIAWLASDKDRRTLIMEGSAVITFSDGSHKAVEYVKGSKNNAHYQETVDREFHGAQDVTLSPGYSLAVDRSWIPLGTPLWLMTNLREDFTPKQKPQPFQRLMIAQDIGKAIRGAVRGDMYWGPGAKATKVANNIKNTGAYWLLLPKCNEAS